MKCIFIKHCPVEAFGSSNQDPWLKAEIEIPFAPYVGLWIDLFGVGDGVGIKSVVYKAKENLFLCAFPPLSRGLGKFEIAEEVDNHLYVGWKLERAGFLKTTAFGGSYKEEPIPVEVER